MNKETGGTMEMPMGMAMAVAQNPAAMNAFCKLSENERSELIARARSAHSRDEMKKIVGELAEMG